MSASFVSETPSKAFAKSTSGTSAIFTTAELPVPTGSTKAQASVAVTDTGLAGNKILCGIDVTTAYTNGVAAVAGSATFTFGAAKWNDLDGESIILTDDSGVIKTFTAKIGKAETNTILVFTDKPDEESYFLIEDSEGTKRAVIIDNEANGTSVSVAGYSNIICNGIAAAGGGSGGTAADIVAKINADAIKITASSPSASRVKLVQDVEGTAGLTAITTNDASHWGSVTSGLPTVFEATTNPSAAQGEFSLGVSATAAASNFETIVEDATNGFNGTIAVSTSSGAVTMTMATAGVAGNKSIGYSSNFVDLLDTSAPAQFTSGADATTPSLLAQTSFDGTDWFNIATVASNISAASTGVKGGTVDLSNYGSIPYFRLVLNPENTTCLLYTSDAADE